MTCVSIQDASRALNVSQNIIRRYAREGRLEAKREPKPSGGTSWVVLLPEGQWDDDFRTQIHALEQALTPWWCPTVNGQGIVHYVQSLGIEEVSPVYLCGRKSADIWPATGHKLEQRCPNCLAEVSKRGLPMETRE